MFVQARNNEIKEQKMSSTTTSIHNSGVVLYIEINEQHFTNLILENNEGNKSHKCIFPLPRRFLPSHVICNAVNDQTET